MILEVTYGRTVVYSISIIIYIGSQEGLGCSIKRVHNSIHDRPINDRVVCVTFFFVGYMHVHTHTL